MQQAVQIELMERILGYAAINSRQMVEREARIPVEEYLSQQRFEHEVASCFRRYPLLIGHSSELARPGDFITRDIGGLPVLATQNQAGQLRAFVNLCRHRGAKVEGAICGRGKRAFVCPYHAWAYDGEGRLIGIPDADGFAGLDRASHGLVALPLAERHGFLWLLPTAGAPLDLDEFLDGIGADFAGFDVSDHVVYRPHTIHARINWKLMVDTFLETYHFQFLHNKSVGPLFVPNAMTFDAFGPHSRMITPKQTILGLRGAPSGAWRLREHTLPLYFIFPNTVVTYLDDHVVVFSSYPVDVQNSRLEIGMYIPKPVANDSEEAHWRANLDLVCAALAEDFATGETMQAGFPTGVNRELVIGRYEMGIAPFHAEVGAALARHAAA